MSRQVIKPDKNNGFSIYMLRLENGNIVHIGGYCPYPYGMAKILCTFCGAWKRDERVETYFMKSKNGTTISSGSICISSICAKKYEGDKKKYIENCAFLQELLNIEDRLEYLRFVDACHKSASVPSNKFTHMLTIKPMHRHISSFLSEEK